MKITEANEYEALGRALKKMVAAIIVLLLVPAHKKVVEINKKL